MLTRAAGNWEDLLEFLFPRAVRIVSISYGLLQIDYLPSFCFVYGQLFSLTVASSGLDFGLVPNSGTDSLCPWDLTSPMQHMPSEVAHTPDKRLIQVYHETLKMYRLIKLTVSAIKLVAF